MRRSRALIALAVVATLGGCASLSGKQCRDGDWKQIGAEDGERGRPAQELERHREACAKHDVTPDAEAYRAGHEQGLAKYCTPRGGYLAGRRQEDYRDVCPAASAPAFLEAHRHGRDVGNVVIEVRALRRRLQELEMAAMHGDYSPEDRTQMRFLADDLNQRLRIKEWELERLDRQYARRYGAPELSWTEIRE